MNPSTLLLLLLLLILPLSLAASSLPRPTTCKGIAGVAPTCKAVAAAHPNIHYNYCTTSINLSHPDPDHEDLPGLAASVARLAHVHADSVEEQVDELMELEHDHELRSRYDECQDAFNDAGNVLKDAVDAINSKQYAKAMRMLHTSHGAHGRCDRAFEGAPEGEVAPVVATQEDAYERLAELAAAILGMVDV